MKKYISIVLCLVLALSLCACAEKKSFDPNAASAETVEEVIEETAEEKPTFVWLGHIMTLIDLKEDTSVGSFSAADGYRFVHIKVACTDGTLTEDETDAGRKLVKLVDGEGNIIDSSISITRKLADSGEGYDGFELVYAVAEDIAIEELTARVEDADELFEMHLADVPAPESAEG